MTFISIGYDGTVGEVEWSQMAPNLAGPPHVIGGFEGRVIVGADRTVGISAGVANGFGVHDMSDAEVQVQCDLQSSGTRYDTVVLRRSWGLTPGGDTSVVVVKGTSAAAIANTIQVQPGTIADQPLFLAQVDAGQSTIVRLIDMRSRAFNGMSVPSLSVWQNAPQGSIARVPSNGARPSATYERTKDSSGALVWSDGSLTEPLNMIPGWDASTGSAFPRFTVSPTGWVAFYGRVTRTATGRLTAGNTQRFTYSWLPAARPPAIGTWVCGSANGPIEVRYHQGYLYLLAREDQDLGTSWYLDLSAIGYQREAD